MKNVVLEVTEDDDITVTIGEKELQILDEYDEFVRAECQLDDLNDVTTEDYPSILTLAIFDTHGFGTRMFHEVEIFSRDETINIEFQYHFPNKHWEGKWGHSLYLETLRDQVDFFDNVTVSDIELEDDYKRIHLLFTHPAIINLEDAISIDSEVINRAIKQTELTLSGVAWKTEYQTDEDLFCREILEPLLRRMQFLAVRYTHGKKEYGKDFIFAELTPFRDIRYYGLQAKAGDVSGRVNSAVDELIGQIDDAFSMPFYELGSKSPCYISVFIIAISGRFTENARDKIAQKINPGLTGSVYFLDRDKIQELIERYWLKS